MNDSVNLPNRRLGPVAFRAEARVTTLRSAPSSNPGGVGEAKTPTRETPKGSKDLRVSGLATWTVVGVLVTVLGLALLAPVVAMVGILICAIALKTHRTNRTELRLRGEFDQKGFDK